MTEEQVDDAALTNYVRLQVLINKSNKALCKAFIKNWNAGNNDKWDDTEANRTNFINGPGKVIFHNAFRIQKECLYSRNISHWDFSLLFQAVKCLDADIPEKIYDDIKFWRNKLSHLEEPKVNDEQFEYYWRKISNLLLQVGISQKQIDKIKSKRIEIDGYKPPQVKKRAEIFELKEAGNSAFQKQKYEEAIDLYSKAIGNPDLKSKELALLYSNRSAAFLKLGDVSSAKEDAKCSVDLCPTWWKGYYRLANAYKAAKSYQLAVKNLLLSKQFNDKPQLLEDEINLCIRLINKPVTEDHYNPEYRKQITLAHRARFKQLLSLMLKNKYKCFMSVEPSLEPKGLKDLPTLKPIYLEQTCKRFQDRIFKGYVLKLTLMEDPHEKMSEGTGIHTIARDDQNSYQRLSFYDYSPTRNELLTTLGFGSKISIINPYYRIAMDGNACIRVDDFSTVYIHQDLKNQKICRYCGEENYVGQPVLCRACKRCYYCSKRCLQLDATELQHSYICNLAFAFDESREYDY